MSKPTSSRKGRNTLADRFATLDAQRAYYSELGKKGGSGQVRLKLTDEDREGLRTAYRFIERIAARDGFDLAANSPDQ